MYYVVTTGIFSVLGEVQRPYNRHHEGELPPKLRHKLKRRVTSESSSEFRQLLGTSLFVCCNGRLVQVS